MTISRFLLFLAYFISLPAFAQQATEVYLFDLEIADGSVSLSNPLNVSSNPGRYDNQPHFSSKGGLLYFVSQDATPQIDIYIYNVKNGLKSNFSNNASNEYSPTPTPDGKYISCIREVDNTQLLWKIPLKKGEPSIVVPDLVIGYHAWRDDNTLVSFVLGAPQTLQVSDLSTQTHTVVASNVGRSIHKIPGTDLISFIQHREGQLSSIQSLDTKTGEIATITEALPDSQDMAWMSSGKIAMGQGQRLFMWSPESGNWQEFKNSSILPDLGNITRVAISPKNDKIAIVVNE